MMAVIAGALTLVLVAGGGFLLAFGDVGALVARLTPTAKLSAFGIVLVLVAATGWTLGSIGGPIGDPATPPVTSEHGHGG